MAHIHDYIVFIGRMQCPHKVHLNIIRQALQKGKELIILIGSANSPRTCKNPWTVSEREQMIRSCLTPEQNSKTHIQGIEDRLYNEALWIQQVQRVVDNITSCNKDVALIGCHKNSSSFYLDEFPQWRLIDFPECKDVHSTDIRNVYLDPNQILLDDLSREKLEAPIEEYLIEFAKSKAYQYLTDEFNFLTQHKEKWKHSPYPPSFNCADAVVFCSGHVLLIKRRNAPGKNCFGVPGGYINNNEHPVDAAIRELIEETKLKGPTASQLKRSIFADRVFSHPERSLRGRIYSHAYGINLGNGQLPRVKGSDDAIKAKWFTLEEVDNMRHELFEDHADIIAHFKGLIGNE